MNWSVIISALGVAAVIVGATAKLVAAWGVAAHQLEELRKTLANTLERLGRLEAWKERSEGREEGMRDMSGRVR